MTKLAFPIRFLLILGFALPICLSDASVVYLKDGTKAKGNIVRQNNREIVLETAPGIRTEILRDEIDHIEGGDVTVAPTAPTPSLSTATTASANPNASPWAPTIITQPNFRSKGTWGGLSDGKLVGIDGQPLAEHKAFSIDTSYFIRKVKEGIKKLTPADASRIRALSSIASLDALIKNLQEDKTQGYKLVPNVDDTITVKEKELAVATESYAKTYGGDPIQATEYEFLSIVAELESACRAYDKTEGTINYEEQIRVNDRIQLDVSPNARGTELRAQLKAACQRMAEGRAKITKTYSNYLNAVRLPEEDAGEKEVRLSSKDNFGTRILLFPYPNISVESGGIARNGLLEDFQGKEISQAKPIIVPKGATMELLKKEIITFPKKGVNGEDVSFEISQVSVQSDGLIDLKANSKLPMIRMEGWIVSDRLK